MKRQTTLCVLSLLLGISLTDPVLGAGPHHDHAHDVSGLELGFSSGYVHLEEENDDALGLHIHISHRLGREGMMERLALGVGGEAIIADEEHYSLLFPLSIYPWRGLVLAVAPGVEWADHEGDWESAYATHLEATYVFEFGDYDMGPVVGYSKSDEEHFMIGVHFGIHL